MLKECVFNSSRRGFIVRLDGQWYWSFNWSMPKAFSQDSQSVWLKEALESIPTDQQDLPGLKNWATGQLEQSKKTYRPDCGFTGLEDIPMVRYMARRPR